MNMKAQYEYFPDAQMPEAPPPTYEESFPMFPDKDYNTGSYKQHTHQQHTNQQHTHQQYTHQQHAHQQHTHQQHAHQQHTHQQHTHQQHNLSTTSTTTGIRSNAGAQQQMKNSSMTVFIFLS